MPPTTAHFNGSVNLTDAETVMREIASRVPSDIHRASYLVTTIVVACGTSPLVPLSNHHR